MSAHGRNHWIKLYVEMNHDPKIGLLTDDLKWRFTSLLLLAGEIGSDGFLPEIGEMAWTLRTSPDTLAGQMRTLAGRELVELRVHPDGGERWFVTKFAERQAPSSNAERQKQWRQRNSAVTTVTKRNAEVTPEAETETETEVGTGPDVEHDLADLPTDLPEFLTPAQVAAIVDERQKSSDPVVILEEYLAGKIPGKPNRGDTDYDRYWRMPILQMVTLTNSDTALAKSLIDAALDEARKPKAKDGQPYRIVRPSGLLPFFQTQLEHHRAGRAAADDDTIWQRALAAVTRRDFTDERLKAAIRAIGGTGRIASANGHDTETLKRSLGHAYRNTATA